MAEEKKQRIVIASVLKPVDDTRMFEKIGMSLHSTGLYEIHVIGYKGNSEPLPGSYFHAHETFDRISLKRLLAPWKILHKIITIRPKLIIITTHELLWISMMAKMIAGSKVVYDVQENYFLNILYTDSFLRLLRPMIAAYVRLKEVLLSGFIDHFFLAEAGYEKELPFGKKKRIVIANKVRRPTSEIVRNDQRGTSLIFSGTLAETTGIFTAIELALKLRDTDHSVTLTIIGYCPRQETLYKIINTIEPYSFIKLVGGDKLVSHQEILACVAKSDFGIIAYPPNVSTASSTPTKLYEYLGYRLPILLINYKPWVEYCAPYNAAVVFESRLADAASVYHAMKTKRFYSKFPEDVYWESEGVKLERVVSSLVSI
jgi:glycosyltransferase involved in cell wall biosynthesis